jgi:bifunctional DNA-binding transcriptional regulator/antitoxin component of YhaV-PrlF toxin-antitoxin module
VIPREAREALHLKAGHKLLVSVRGDCLIVLQKPTKFSAAIRGIGAGSYPPDYRRKERESWD